MQDGFAGERGKFGRFCCVNPSVKIGCEEPILTAPFTQGSLRALPRRREALGAEEGGTVAGVLQSAANLKIT